VSELRWDPLRDNWVIMTLGQGRWPLDFVPPQSVVTSKACPFCAGNESFTPPEIQSFRPAGSAPNQPGWQVRVIPNRFPVLRIEGDLDSRAEGLYDRINGIGAHEVIIETPQHGKTLADLSVEEITEVLKVYRARLLDLRNDSRFRYLFVCKNHGVGAASNISHSHSQVIAVPVLPPLVKTELDRCREHFSRKARCLICDLIHQEQKDGSRVVRDDGNFIVYSPYAAKFPFGLMIAPLTHSHDFTAQNDVQLQQLALVLRDTLKRIGSVLRDPPFSFVLHSAPPLHSRDRGNDEWINLPESFHWHIELAPKLTRSTGFDWGSGFHINPTPPEEAADFLRRADIHED